MTYNFNILINRMFSSTTKDFKQSNLKSYNNYLLNEEGEYNKIVDEYNVRGFIDNARNQAVISGFMAYLTGNTLMNELMQTSNGTEFKASPAFKEIYYNDKKLAEVFNDYYNNTVLRGSLFNEKYLSNQISNLNETEFEYKLFSKRNNNFLWNTGTTTMLPKYLQYIPLDFNTEQRNREFENVIIKMPTDENYFINILLQRKTAQISRDNFELCDKKIIKSLSLGNTVFFNLDSTNIEDGFLNSLIERNSTVRPRTIPIEVNNSNLDITPTISIKEKQKQLIDKISVVSDELNLKKKEIVNDGDDVFTDDQIYSVVRSFYETKGYKKINKIEKQELEKDISLRQQNVYINSDGFEDVNYVSIPFAHEFVLRNNILFEDDIVNDTIRAVNFDTNIRIINEAVLNGTEHLLSAQTLTNAIDTQPEVIVSNEQPQLIQCFVDLNLKTNENEFFSNIEVLIGLESSRLSYNEEENFQVKVLLSEPAFGNESFKVSWEFQDYLLQSSDFEYGVEDKFYYPQEGQEFILLDIAKVLLDTLNLRDRRCEIKLSNLFNLQYRTESSSRSEITIIDTTDG